MAGFIRRYETTPPLDVITEIEGVIVVDKTPSGVTVGRSGGVVSLVGEWPGGPYNEPTVVEGDQTIQQTFGGFHLSMRNPLSPSTDPYSNGCAFTWLRGKRFKKLVLTRVDMRLAEGVNIRLVGTGTLASDILIPAGTRVYDASAPTREFALAQDITFNAGIALGVSASTVYTDALQAAGFDTRTISDVPVYSVQGVNESGVGDVDTVNATDQFRANIGAGTDNPSLSLTCSTALFDTAPANSAALTALSSGTIDTRYDDAIQATLPGTNEVNDDTSIRASARTSVAIRASLLSAAGTAALSGARSICLVRPIIGTVQATAVASGAEGVGEARSDRRVFCYPHVTQRIPELASLDPEATLSEATILIGADAAMASVLSMIPSEDNPGRSTQEELSGGLLQWISGLESGLTTASQPTIWDVENYKAFKAAGIAAVMREPRIAEWVFASGVTSVSPTAYPARVPISRRRMADELQDVMSTIALRYSKKTRKPLIEDAFIGDLLSYLRGLLSENAPDFARIAGFTLDPTGANTALLQGSGINGKLVQVQLLESNDFILLVTEIGQSVQLVE